MRWVHWGECSKNGTIESKWFKVTSRISLGCSTSVIWYFSAIVIRSYSFQEVFLTIFKQFQLFNKTKLTTLSMLDSFKRIIDVWARRSNMIRRAFREHTCCGLNISSKKRSLNMCVAMSCITWFLKVLNRLHLGFWKQQKNRKRKNRTYFFSLFLLEFFGHTSVDQAHITFHHSSSRKSTAKPFLTFFFLLLPTQIDILYRYVFFEGCMCLNFH